MNALLVAAVLLPTANPVLDPWIGPNGGWPAFDKVKVADMKPALEQAMADNLKEIDVIAAVKDPATFDNTIVALEKSGQELSRARTIYGIWTGSMLTDDVKKVQDEMEPKLAAHQDKITQN